MQKSCCTVGKFEAFHRGHRKLIERAKELCDRVKVISIRGKGEKLFTDKEREEIARRLGVELLNIPFSQVKDMSPRQFFERLREWGCSALVVGEDWQFGRNREGDIETAERLGREFGIPVFTVPPETEKGEKIGATKIKELLSKGRVEEANALLGFPYFATGRVVKGTSKGKKIGFPTVNVKPFKELPLTFGVYAVNLIVDGESYRGVANYGRAPTLKDTEPLIEVFVPERELPSLYGRDVKVEFLKFLRPEKRFPSVDELVKQIKLDVENLKEFWRIEVGTGDKRF